MALAHDFTDCQLERQRREKNDKKLLSPKRYLFFLGGGGYLVHAIEFKFVSRRLILACFRSCLGKLIRYGRAGQKYCP